MAIVLSNEIDRVVSFTVDYDTHLLPMLEANRSRTISADISRTGCQKIVKHSQIRQYLKKHTREKILDFRVLLDNNPTDMVLEIGKLLHYVELNFKIEENEDKLKVLNVYGLPKSGRNCFCSAGCFGRREDSSRELIGSVVLKSPELKKRALEQVQRLFLVI